MKAICCMGIDGAIGADSKTGLPWDYPEDLKRFKNKTMGSILIAGHTTAKKLPRLVGRQLAVVAGGEPRLEHNPNVIWINHQRVHNTFTDAENIWVIGGNRTWATYQTRITEWHITRIFQTFGNATEYFNFRLLAGFKCKEIYDNSVDKFKATTEVWKR